jgi:hypothetical protein
MERRTGRETGQQKRLSAMLKQRRFENYQRSDNKFYWKGLTLKT